ncbi:MAG: diaminopimelate decarboxylase [Clostridia bacterium]|nr:diaminopimelate decarboxylase [Clostridia bacterium]
MKTPFLTKDQAEALTKTYPTPFHIYDEAGIRKNVRRLKAAFAWNEGFKEYFAVKATPTPGIMKILIEEGCGLDCSSYTELMLAEMCGVTGHEIMFSSNETPAEEFKKAHELGAIINLDDLTHVDFLQEVCGETPETICMRFNPGGYFTLSNNIMDNPGDAKYGMTRVQLSQAIKTLASRGAKRFGVHAFLASNTNVDDYYPRLSRTLFKAAAQLAEESGLELAFVNLSGGIGIPYYPEEDEVDIFRVGNGVREAFENILVPAGHKNCAIFTELGRYMLAPYGALLTRAIHEKHIHKEYIGVDACAANLMRPAMYGAYHHITVLGKENAPLTNRYDVVGSLCENNDKFAVDRMLPEIEKGDLLYIHDTGAHGFSMGYNYNGRLRSAEILLKEDGSAEMIRRAETPEDYFATLKF